MPKIHILFEEATNNSNNILLRGQKCLHKQIKHIFSVFEGKKRKIYLSWINTRYEFEQEQTHTHHAIKVHIARNIK